MSLEAANWEFSLPNWAVQYIMEEYFETESISKTVPISLNFLSKIPSNDGLWIKKEP